MKLVNYTDKAGYRKRSLIRDNDDPDTAAPYGIPAGPPDFRVLDWDGMMKEASNALAVNGIFTWDDVQSKPVGIQPAMSVFKRYIIGLYREDTDHKIKG